MKADASLIMYQEQQRKTEVLAVAINEPYENWFAPNWFPEGE